MEALNDRFTDLNSVLEDSDSAQYDETIKEMDEWRSKKFNRDLVDLRNQTQQVLGVETTLEAAERCGIVAHKKTPPFSGGACRWRTGALVPD